MRAVWLVPGVVLAIAGQQARGHGVWPVVMTAVGTAATAIAISLDRADKRRAKPGG